jgi:hypothetical protein
MLGGTEMSEVRMGEGHMGEGVRCMWAAKSEASEVLFFVVQKKGIV